MTKEFKSLSTKIVLSISLVSLLSVVVIFNVFERINKQAFYNVEMEKADLVLKTIEPLIALNIYLDMDGKIDSTLSKLIENPNILAVKVLKDDKIIKEIKSKDYSTNVDKSFKVEKSILQPNSQKKIGTLLLVYSTKNYKELIDKYTTLLIEILIALVLFFLLFSLYVKRLLSPLRQIAKALKNFSPNKKVNLPLIKEHNEIGLISNALNDMQKKILEYAKKQEDENHFLEEKVNEKTVELRKQLYTNSLTGLPNRLSLFNEINKYKDGALLVINIDDFKEINDFFGHIAGDTVLISFARTLDNMFAHEDDVILMHLSGDEFALLFTRKPLLNEFIQIAQRLIENVEKMVFYHENNELSIRITIGGAFQIEGALEKADIALKSAKQQKKSFLLYDGKHNVEKLYKNNIEWGKKLAKAIEEDRIIPYFQPIYDNVSNKIVSVESLIRLIDDNNKVITPYEFLTIAKKSKLYSKLTKIMVQKSCKYFEYIDCDFSVNLSVEDILDEATIEYIKYNIEKYNVSKKIIFEILETEGIENYQEVSTFISEMKALGCRIAIDDFGSGYSSFEHLLRLDIDYIKIDGSLIKDLDTDPNAQMIVETIVDFAKKIQVLTIAEYVHNEAVNLKVKELKVDRTQGFFLAEPQAEFSLS